MHCPTVFPLFSAKGHRSKQSQKFDHKIETKENEIERIMNVL